MHHKLKILECYYHAVRKGEKLFEIRKNNDRGFQKGDTVELMPIDGNGVYMADPNIITKITYVTNYEQKDDYVVFGFEVIDG